MAAFAISLPAAASAGELYMGMSAGPSPHVGGPIGTYYEGYGHAAFGFVMGGVVEDLQLDLVMFGAGYHLLGPTAADAALLLIGGDVGRRVTLTSRLSATPKIGFHGGGMLRMTDEDEIPPARQLSGWGWSYGLEAIYTFGKLKSQAPPSNPIRFLTGELVLEARRERMFLTSEEGGRFDGAATMVMLGLRFGALF